MKSDLSSRSISWGKRIDFHTHILPEMDDGSSSVEMSIQMIQKSFDQGVSVIVLTPHFYPLRDNPKHFLAKRAAKTELLRSGFRQELPQLLLGAEVQYFEGITTMHELPYMCIEKSTGLMVEMPMCKWTNRMISDISELNRRREYQVVLAHAERYLPFGNLQNIRELADDGVTMQISADAFHGFFGARQVIKMLDEGIIHILGSDSHNMISRAPNLDEAYEVIEKKRGEGAVNKIMDNGYRLLTMMNDNNKFTAPERSLTL